MKKLVCIFIVVLLSVSVDAQVAKIKFLDGTSGFALGPKLVLNRVGDTLTFESVDQKVWQLEIPTQGLLSKRGVIQKIVSSNQEIYAKINFLSGSGDILEDWSVGLFSVGDTIQVVKRKDAEGENVYRMYFGCLPGKTPEENQVCVIKKIYR